jgi:hypothetical protein
VKKERDEAMALVRQLRQISNYDPVSSERLKEIWAELDDVEKQPPPTTESKSLLRYC